MRLSTYPGTQPTTRAKHQGFFTTALVLLLLLLATLPLLASWELSLAVWQGFQSPS